MSISHLVRAERTLFIGELHASATPLTLRTLLGSCIAVCLFDPVAHVGGMNHFALPGAPDQCTRTSATRFGLPAMTQLLRAISTVGGAPHRLVATIVGGGHLLAATVANDIPQRNIAFARLFLARERIEIVAEDIGAHCPRQVRFDTDTGEVFVRHVRMAGSHARPADSRAAPVPFGAQLDVVRGEQ